MADDIFNEDTTDLLGVGSALSGTGNDTPCKAISEIKGAIVSIGFGTDREMVHRKEVVWTATHSVHLVLTCMVVWELDAPANLALTDMV